MRVYGTIEEKPTHSILTERPLNDSGKVTERVTGTEFLYSFEGRYANRVTDELRAEWKANCPKTKKKKVATVPVIEHEEEQNNESG